MLTAKEKAVKLLDLLKYTPEAKKLAFIERTLNEQDNETRQVCAEAITQIPEDMSTSNFKMNAVMACYNAV